MLEGIARKVAFLLVFISAVGWIAFDVGLGMRYAMEQTNSTIVQPQFFSYWCFATSAAPLYVMTFIHLLCGNVCTATVVFLLLPVFLVSAGGVLNTDGLSLFYKDNSVDHEKVEFSGVLTSVTLFWMALLLWAWFSNRNKKKDYTPIN